MKIISVVALIFMLGCVLSVYSAEQKKCDLAGLFYPGNQSILHAALEEYLQHASVTQNNEELIGVIAPHAGYSYSGSIAAYAYKALTQNMPEAIIILAQAHRYSFSGISVYPSGSFDTPLGALDVDEKVAGWLSGLSFNNFDKKAFANENALETQLPFIKKVLSGAKIVPLIFGEVSVAQLQELAEKLAEISKKKRIAIVASTDLSHYLSYEDAKRIDAQTIQSIKNKDFYVLGQCENCACGINPVITFILYAKIRDARIEILAYANSGDTSGDKRQVVGYLSAAAYCPLTHQNEPFSLRTKK